MVVAAGVVGADGARHLSSLTSAASRRPARPVRIVIDRPAGLGVNTLGPGHLGVLRRIEETGRCRGRNT